MDCAAQSMDPCFAQPSIDCPLNPWIAQTRELSMDLTKPWIDVRCFQCGPELLHVCLFGFCATNKRTVCSNDGCMLLILSYQSKPQLASSIINDHLFLMTPQQCLSRPIMIVTVTIKIQKLIAL